VVEAEAEVEVEVEEGIAGGIGGKSSPAICGGIGGIKDASTDAALDPVPEVEVVDIAPEEEPPPVADADVCGRG